MTDEGVAVSTTLPAYKEGVFQRVGCLARMLISSVSLGLEGQMWSTRYSLIAGSVPGRVCDVRPAIPTGVTATTQFALIAFSITVDARTEVDVIGVADIVSARSLIRVFVVGNGNGGVFMVAVVSIRFFGRFGTGFVRLGFSRPGSDAP